MSNVVCTICGRANAVSVLVGREDREYRVNSRLNYYRCSNLDCRHVQSYPVPNDDEIASFYLNYTTHERYRPHGFALVINRITELLADSQLSFLCGNGFDVKSTRILDYGCGNGINLERLSRKGFHQLVGFDFDPQAAAFVVNQGFVCYSKIEDLEKEDSFDIVFLNHVIEHMSDPKSSIIDIFKRMRSDGLLVIRTPNAQSFLARLCGDNWRGWETPRHLNIFTYASLFRLFDDISGCEVVQVNTSNHMAFAMAISSIPEIFSKYKIIKLIGSMILTVASLIINMFDKKLGEEIVLMVRKK